MKKDVIKIPYRCDEKKPYEKEKGYSHITEKGSKIFVHKNVSGIGWRVSDYKTGYLICNSSELNNGVMLFDKRQVAIDEFVKGYEDRYMQIIKEKRYQDLIVNK